MVHNVVYNGVKCCSHRGVKLASPSFHYRAPRVTVSGLEIRSRNWSGVLLKYYRVSKPTEMGGCLLFQALQCLVINVLYIH